MHYVVPTIYVRMQGRGSFKVFCKASGADVVRYVLNGRRRENFWDEIYISGDPTAQMPHDY